jgi:hypothetical protein
MLILVIIAPVIFRTMFVALFMFGAVLDMHTSELMANLIWPVFMFGDNQELMM